MGRGNSGKGRGSGGPAIKAPSNLEAFKENARQFNQALQDARKAGAAVVEFKTITGSTVRRYWNGATWGDRPSSMEARYGKKRTGTFKAKFKAPKSWG